MIVELAGKRILVDPMLDDAGARPPIEGTRNQVAEPDRAACRSRPRRSCAGSTPSSSRTATATTSTTRAEELLPRDVPVFCQPEDEEALRDARPRRAARRRRARVGRPPHHANARDATASGRIAELLAPVSGFLLDDLYLAGDTVWYEGVEETIERHRPRVAVVNAGGAEFLEGGLIIMGIDDVREVAARVPTVVAVHMEALNHCYLTRAELRAAVPSVLVPEDGETLEL